MDFKTAFHLIFLLFGCLGWSCIVDVASAADCLTEDIEYDPPKSEQRIVGEMINEEVAMAFLHCGYDPGKKEVWWRPKQRSEMVRRHFSKRSKVRVKTEVAFAGRYLEEGRPKYLILTQTRPFNDRCHACQIVIGGALFLKENGFWRLEALNRTIAMMGSWGRAPENMCLIRMGGGHHAVLIRDHYMSNGEHTESISIIAQIGGHLEEMVMIPKTAGHNHGLCTNDIEANPKFWACWSFTSKIEWIKGNDPIFYDIRVITEGTLPESFHSVRAYRRIRLYRYMGCYIEGDATDGEGVVCAIQLGAFSRYPTVCHMVHRLRDEGFLSYCDTTTSVDGQTLFRLRVAAGDEGQTAEDLLNRLNSLGYDGIVVRP